MSGGAAGQSVEAGHIIHFIEVEREADGISRVRFACKGGAESPCHTFPDCGCEQWTQAVHGEDAEPEHASVAHEDECWQEPWMNAVADWPSDFAAQYDGPEPWDPEKPEWADLAWLVSGPVDVTYQGDYVTWEYLTSRPEPDAS